MMEGSLATPSSGGLTMLFLYQPCGLAALHRHAIVSQTRSPRVC